MGDGQAKREVEVLVEGEVVPRDVEVPVAGPRDHRVLVGGVEHGAGGLWKRNRAGESLASVCGTRDTDHEVAGGGVDREGGVIEVAARVDGEPGVTKVLVARRVGNGASVGEGGPAISRVRVPGQIGACREKWLDQLLRVVEADHHMQPGDSDRGLALRGLVDLVAVVGRVVDSHVGERAAARLGG